MNHRPALLSPRISRWIFTWAFIGLLGLVAFVAARAPALGTVAIIATVTAVTLFVAPKPALLLIGVFLLLQPILISLLGGPENPLGLTLQRIDEGVAVAGILRIIYMMTWESIRTLTAKWVWHAVLFLLCGLISGLIAGVPTVPLLLGAFLAVKVFIFVLMSLTVRWEPGDAGRLLKFVLTAGPILLVLGLTVQLMPAEVRGLLITQAAEREGFFARGGITAMQGPFVHPGLFGWAMAVVGCYAGAAILIGSGRWTVLVLAASVIGMIASLRRKPLVALPVALLFGAVIQGSVRRRWMLLGSLAILGAGVFLFSGERVKSLVAETSSTYLDRYAPTTSRVLLYVTGYAIAKDRFPLGAGFGRFGGYVSELYYSPVYVQYGLSEVYGLSPDVPDYIQDTYWPHVMGETGWVGTAVLAAFFVAVLARLGRIARKSPTVETRILALAAAMVLVEALIESVAAPIFEATLTSYVIAVPVGIALVLGTTDSLNQSRVG